MAENFDLIFGQGASSQYAWSDSDYQNGWQTVGSTPPTAEQFDALQRRNDLKAQELNTALIPLVNANTTDSRQLSTEYSVGDIRFTTLIPTGWYLECTVAGTSSSSELEISDIADGNTVTDGTVTWTIHNGAQSSTSFGTAVINHLLSSDLASLITAVSTNSTYKAMLEKALSAAGLQYNIASNGYICFGSLFGGLILQWGQISFTANQQMITVTLPITMNGFLSAAFSATSNALQNAFSFYNTGGNYKSTFEIGVNGTVSSSQIVRCRYIIIGY